MKKIFALAFTLCLALTAFTACGAKEEKPSSQPTTSAYDVTEILATIEEAAPVRNAAEVGTDYLAWLGIKPETYTNFAGSYCSVTPGVDIILVVEANDGQTDDIKAAMEARKAAIIGENENYDEYYTKKADAGRVVVKGNYVVLAIAGNAETVDQLDGAYAEVDKAIDKAFN